jgi:hypothetical protein
MSDNTSRTGMAEFDQFIGTELTFRALQVWPGVMTEDRRMSIFGSVTIGSTIKLLKHELRMANGSDPMIAIAIKDSQIRRDGYPKTDATPSHPGVIVSFDTKYGRLVYKCDTFRHWSVNLRAIALTLQALRKPDRYGVLNAGEQYTGQRLLTAGGAATTMNVEEAAKLIASYADNKRGAEKLLLSEPQMVDVFFRTASRRAHPDAGGTADRMDQLTKARDTLRAHHGLGV